MSRRVVLTQRQVALRHGFRSGLEDVVSDQLKAAQIEGRYEPFKIEYIKPERKARYTPDFVLSNGIVVETKGRFITEDRQKHLLLKNQHPGIDIRFVFSNPNQRISKQSKTTYAMWCKKHGFIYAKGLIPSSWLHAEKNERSLQALKQFDHG